MNLRVLKQLMFILALASVTLACALGGAAEPTAQPTAAPAQTEAPPAPTQPAAPTATVEPSATPLPEGAFSLPPDAVCQQIQGQAAGALGMAFTLEKAGFDTINGQTGAGCLMKATGTGANFKSTGETMLALTKAMGDAIPDPSQAADGPVGSTQGLWRGNTLIMLNVFWEPAPGTNCPVDQPITNCNLTPEQKLYTVLVSAANSQNPPVLAGPAPTETRQLSVATPPSAFVRDEVLLAAPAPFATTLSGSVANGTFHRFVLNLAAGYNLDLQLASPQQTAGFMLLDPNQKPMPGTENGKALWYSAGVNQAGNYAIVVGSIAGQPDYTLQVKVAPPGSAMPTSAATSAPAAAGYQPLPEEDCRVIRTQAKDVLGVPFAMSQGTFAAGPDAIGTACYLTASGTGNDFTDIATVMTALRGTFSDWTAEPAYDADGPTASQMGLRRGSDLMVVYVSWTPAAGVQCPANQPISACNLTPEQMLYNVQIQAARK